MGMKGRDEHFKVKFGDFNIHHTNEGFKYVEFNERDTKMQTGEFSACRPFMPKMWLSNPGETKSVEATTPELVLLASGVQSPVPSVVVTLLRRNFLSRRPSINKSERSELLNQNHISNTGFKTSLIP